MNGEKKLVCDNYAASFLGTLQNFDKVQITGNSDLSLDKSLGNTVTSLSVNAGSTLRFNRDQDATLDITNNGTIRTSHNLTLKSADTGTGTYQVEGGTLDLAGQAVSGKISLSAGALQYGGTGSRERFRLRHHRERQPGRTGRQQAELH